ncbi:MAG: DNA recombination protein RmuC [Phycisphaerae bacterium]|nr:DNA recombination protein RmuC [Phycisphaerae bacterium]
MADILLIILLVTTVVSLLLNLLILLKRQQLDDALISPRFEHLSGMLSRTVDLIRGEIATNRAEQSSESTKSRLELSQSLKGNIDTLVKTLGDMRQSSSQAAETLTMRLASALSQTESRLSNLCVVVEEKLSALRDENNAKLESIRATVDEKLHQTLEARLTESFKTVSDRLEQVHKGLGEMQSLANGVGDLKKVLTNVSSRGAWGEVQLGAILEQMLAPDQYARNVQVSESSAERVEFAIRLPRNDGDAGAVWLPVDAKFPIEDYQRLLEASDAGDVEQVKESRKQLERRVRSAARTIREKYVQPPATTNFAVLFLPIEGLFAEVLRIPGLIESLQQNDRVTIAGPTTLCALLNSLQMGFRTLAIQKRSSEVWLLLEQVKAEFGKYGDAVEKVQKKLGAAVNEIDNVFKRTRAIDRKLRGVQDVTLTNVQGSTASLDSDVADAE